MIQNNLYQSWKYLYISKVGLRFTLPDGWKLIGRTSTDDWDWERIEISTNQKDLWGYIISMTLSVYSQTERDGCLISYNPIFENWVIKSIKCVPASEITVSKLHEINKEIKPDVIKEYNWVYLFPLAMDSQKDILIPPFDKKYVTDFDLTCSGCPSGEISFNESIHSMIYNSIEQILWSAKKI